MTSKYSTEYIYFLCLRMTGFHVFSLPINVDYYFYFQDFMKHNTFGLLHLFLLINHDFLSFFLSFFL